MLGLPVTVTTTLKTDLTTTSLHLEMVEPLVPTPPTSPPSNLVFLIHPRTVHSMVLSVPLMLTVLTTLPVLLINVS